MDNYGCAPLHMAVVNGQLECVKLLLAHKDINVNIQQLASITTIEPSPTILSVAKFHNVTNSKSLDIPQRILFIQSPSYTPLHFAVYFDNLDCVRLLLAHPRINVNLHENGGRTPLALANKYSLDHTEEIIKLLKQHGGTLL